MDIDTIKPGDDFVEVVEQTVAACDVLIVLVGKQWLVATDRSGRRRLELPEDFVLMEIRSALDRRIRVIPVLVQGATLPSAEEHAGDRRAIWLRFFSQLHDWNKNVDLCLVSVPF